MIWPCTPVEYAYLGVLCDLGLKLHKRKRNRNTRVDIAAFVTVLVLECRQPSAFSTLRSVVRATDIFYEINMW